MPVSNFFETSNYHPRYHSNCRIVRPLTGIYQFLCLNAAFTESVYSAFYLSGFRLRSDKSLEVCLRFSPATGSLCASFPDRLRHRLSSLHSSTRRGMCQSFFLMERETVPLKLLSCTLPRSSLPVPNSAPNRGPSALPQSSRCRTCHTTARCK